MFSNLKREFKAEPKKRRNHFDASNLTTAYRPAPLFCSVFTQSRSFVSQAFSRAPLPLFPALKLHLQSRTNFVFVYLTTAHGLLGLATVNSSMTGREARVATVSRAGSFRCRSRGCCCYCVCHWTGNHRERLGTSIFAVGRRVSSLSARIVSER